MKSYIKCVYLVYYNLIFNMEAVTAISAFFMGVTNVIRSVNQNDNQNSNFCDSEEYRQLQMNYQKEINKIQEESEQKIKALMDESLQREKIIEREYERLLAVRKKASSQS